MLLEETGYDTRTAYVIRTGYAIRTGHLVTEKKLRPGRGTP